MLIVYPLIFALQLHWKSFTFFGLYFHFSLRAWASTGKSVIIKCTSLTTTKFIQLFKYPYFFLSGLSAKCFQVKLSQKRALAQEICDLVHQTVSLCERVGSGDKTRHPPWLCPPPLPRQPPLHGMPPPPPTIFACVKPIFKIDCANW